MRLGGKIISIEVTVHPLHKLWVFNTLSIQCSMVKGTLYGGNQIKAE